MNVHYINKKYGKKFSKKRYALFGIIIICNYSAPPSFQIRK
jgi:hypothetical protein